MIIKNKRIHNIVTAILAWLIGVVVLVVLIGALLFVVGYLWTIPEQHNNGLLTVFTISGTLLSACGGLVSGVKYFDKFERWS